MRSPYSLVGALLDWPCSHWSKSVIVQLGAASIASHGSQVHDVTAANLQVHGDGCSDQPAVPAAR